MNGRTPEEEYYGVPLIVYLSPPSTPQGFEAVEVLVEVSLPGEIVPNFRIGTMFVQPKQ